MRPERRWGEQGRPEGLPGSLCVERKRTGLGEVGSEGKQGNCGRQVGFRIWAALVTQGRGGFRSGVWSRIAGCGRSLDPKSLEGLGSLPCWGLHKHWRQPSCTLAGEQFNTLRHFHSTEHYSVIQRNRLWIHTTRMKSPENYAEQKKSQSQKVTHCIISLIWKS